MRKADIASKPDYYAWGYEDALYKHGRTSVATEGYYEYDRGFSDGAYDEAMRGSRESDFIFDDENEA